MTDDPTKCDVGPLTPDDGCDDECKVEPGWVCEGGTMTTPDVCKDKCGDGITVKSASNYCDDGNSANDDGCSSSCAIESGWS